MSPYYREEGFTLLEMMVVILMLMTLFGSLIPAFGKAIGHLRRAMAIDDLVTLMTYAHQRSIDEGTSYQVAIDGPAQTFQLKRRSAEAFGATYQSIPESIGRTRSLPADGTVSEIQGPATYFPDGTATPTITDFTFPDGISMRLTLSAASGRVAFNETKI